MNLKLKEKLIKNSPSKIDYYHTNISLFEIIKTSNKSEEELNIENEMYLKGLEELKEVIKYIRLFNVPEEAFDIDLSIARGLDYYTGTVYETFLNDYKSIGSICSGGRYNDLAGYYTEKKLPGVGMSIGLTRLFYILNEIGLIAVPTIYSLFNIAGYWDPYSGTSKLEIGIVDSDAGYKTDVLPVDIFFLFGNYVFSNWYNTYTGNSKYYT